MPQDSLDDPQVDACFKESRIAMPQRMDRDALVDARQADGLAQGRIDAAGWHGQYVPLCRP